MAASRTFPGLDGKTALITGAGSGIGRATAELFAEFGAHVVCLDLRLSNAEVTAQTIVAAGGSASSIEVDVVNRTDVFDAIDRAAGDEGRIDIVCNSAGVIEDVLPSTVSAEVLGKVMAVNFYGAVYVTQAALPYMSAGASVINITTGGLDKPTAGIFAYAASKAAMTEFTRCLALEVGEKGIRVNSIAPGYIETPMITRNHVDASGNSGASWNARIDVYRSMSPLGLIGSSEDVAWAALYLASAASKFTTGQVIRPNGGFTMPR